MKHWADGNGAGASRIAVAESARKRELVSHRIKQ